VPARPAFSDGGPDFTLPVDPTPPGERESDVTLLPGATPQTEDELFSQDEWLNRYQVESGAGPLTPQEREAELLQAKRDDPVRARAHQAVLDARQEVSRLERRIANFNTPEERERRNQSWAERVDRLRAKYDAAVGFDARNTAYWNWYNASRATQGTIDNHYRDLFDRVLEEKRGILDSAFDEYKKEDRRVENTHVYSDEAGVFASLKSSYDITGGGKVMGETEQVEMLRDWYAREDAAWAKVDKTGNRQWDDDGGWIGNTRDRVYRTYDYEGLPPFLANPTVPEGSKFNPSYERTGFYRGDDMDPLEKFNDFMKKYRKQPDYDQYTGVYHKDYYPLEWIQMARHIIAEEEKDPDYSLS